jgi:hypothetical protein
VRIAVRSNLSVHDSIYKRLTTRLATLKQIRPLEGAEKKKGGT